MRIWIIENSCTTLADYIGICRGGENKLVIGQGSDYFHVTYETKHMAKRALDEIKRKIKAGAQFIDLEEIEA